MTADITLDELNMKMPEVGIVNGWLNRFLLVCARRSQILPLADSRVDEALTPIAMELREAIALAQARHNVEVSFTPEARAEYESWYDAQPVDVGLLAAATARGEVQVVRLALTYALLDGADRIGLPHLHAALAFWEYASASAAYVFGVRLGNRIADRLLSALR